ncbi:MAG: LamG domain-containing protein [Parafilimonas sp.]|nr:LamG domain-containing protein [Parafilimonas sp.]
MKRNNLLRITLQLFTLIVTLAQLSSCKKDTSGVAINSSGIANVTVKNLDTNLVAWYNFNGDIKDHSRYHNDITFNNATPTSGRNGESNNAYFFNGFSSYMRVANSASLNPRNGVTLVAVIKPMGFYSGECHYNRIMQKSFDDFTNGRMELGFSDQPYYNYEGCDAEVSADHETFYGSYGNGSNASGASATGNYITLDKWYTLIYTFDGSVSNLYINNVLAATDTHATTYTPNNNDLLIGKTLNPSFPYWFTGIIDGIRIYNKAMSAGEVHNLYSYLQVNTNQ